MSLQSLKLYIIVFLSGAVVMALEMTGSRVVAPYLGTSIYVWTSLIGIILAALSLGYWWGGRIADRRPNYGSLSSVLVGATVLTLLIPILQHPVLIIFSRHQFDLRLAAVVGSLVLFGGPAVMLGMITPFAVRLKMEQVEKSGETAGGLYAVSTVGSIVGTFLAGFVLISLLKTSGILLLLSLILLVISIIAEPSHLVILKVVLLFVWVSLCVFNRDFREALRADGLIDTDTAYHHVIIRTLESKEYKRTVRFLATDYLGSQAFVFVDAPNELAGEYGKYVLLAFHYAQDPKDFLLIGGGAYMLPRYFAANYPQTRMDVVEIDPELTELAEEYFFLDKNPKFTIYHEDARTYLGRCTKRYDSIILDAFGSSPSVPFHLTTQEIFVRMKGLLNDNGVLVMNIVTGIDGAQGDYFRAALKTIESVFPTVHIYPVKERDDLSQVQNVMLIAPKSGKTPAPLSDDPLFAELLPHRLMKEIPRDMPILTDDFAPVEYYMLPALVKWRAQQLAKQQENA